MVRRYRSCPVFDAVSHHCLFGAFAHQEGEVTSILCYAISLSY